MASVKASLLSQDQFDKLTDVFRGIFNIPDLTLFDEMTAADVAGWDSFNHINLIITIEQEFDVRFTTEEVSGLKDVGEMMELLATKVDG